MAREDLHFRLRIPETLKKRIERAAERSHRSMTAEIVAALENAFPEPMGIGEFIELHVIPVAQARSEKEKSALTTAANKSAELVGSPWRVRAIEREGGNAAEAYLADTPGNAILTILDSDVGKR